MIKDYNLISSDYVICAAIRDTTFVRHELINPLVARFSEAHEIKDFLELSIEQSFSDIDFPSISFDQIYRFLLDGIRKTESNVSIPTRFILTIDKQNCLQKCRKTDIFYDSIEINGYPFLYFLYIDLSAIISTIRQARSI